MGRSTANAKGRIGARDDHNFVFDSPILQSSVYLVLIQDSSEREGIRSSRVRRYSPYLGDIFEGTRISRLDN